MKALLLSLSLVCACLPAASPTGNYDCKSAQLRLQTLHCPQAVVGTDSFETVCLRYAEEGIDLGVACVSTARDCNGVELCR